MISLLQNNTNWHLSGQLTKIQNSLLLLFILKVSLLCSIADYSRLSPFTQPSGGDHYTLLPCHRVLVISLYHCTVPVHHHHLLIVYLAGLVLFMATCAIDCVSRQLPIWFHCLFIKCSGIDLPLFTQIYLKELMFMTCFELNQDDHLGQRSFCQIVVCVKVAMK